MSAAMVRCGSRCRATSRPVLHFTTRKAAMSSRVDAISTWPSAYWRKAAIGTSPLRPWLHRTLARTKLGATSRRTCSRASALRSITPPWIGAPWLRAGPRNRRLAKVAGKFSTPTGTGSTASTRPDRIIRANGDKAFFGWPNDPQIEAEVAAWYEANTLDEERAIARRLNKAAFEHAIYAPLGLYLQQQAWRTNDAGVAQGPLPFFWGVSKTA